MFSYVFIMLTLFFSNDCYEVVSALPMDVQINIKGSLFMYKGQLITIP